MTRRRLEESRGADGTEAPHISERKRESDQIAADQNRIRENMEALKGSSEERALLQRYVGQFDAQESRLAVLRKESGDLRVSETQARAELDRVMMEANVDKNSKRKPQPMRALL